MISPDKMNLTNLKLLVIAVHIAMAAAAPKIDVVPRNVPVSITDLEGLCLSSVKVSFWDGSTGIVVQKAPCNYHGQAIDDMWTVSTEWVFQSGYAAQKPIASPKFAVVLMSSQGHCISPHISVDGVDETVSISTALDSGVVYGAPCDKSKHYMRFKVDGLADSNSVKFTNVETQQALLSSRSEWFTVSGIPARRELDTVQIEKSFVDKVNGAIEAWEKETEFLSSLEAESLSSFQAAVRAESMDAELPITKVA